MTDDGFLSGDMIELAGRVVAANRAVGRTIALAESCTGGLVAAAITEIAGSSAVFDRGFVTYSNEAKRDMLGVSPTTLDAHGAVSSETALAMASGALLHSNADIAVAVTGIAGPGGGTAAKPVGTVVFAHATRDGADSYVERKQFNGGNRAATRRQAALFALGLLLP